MKCEEKRLFRQLCSLKSKEFDQSLLGYATPGVLGHLFFNRMQAVAFGTLKNHELLGKVNREFRNSLKTAYTHNIETNQSYFVCAQYLTDILSECSCRFALLKGALLCKRYPEGYRTSNDIDLLVLPEHVTEVGNVLTQAGFRQGNIRNDEFVPATRREIIESKMMRGETVPYIKEINMPGMRYLEVDINFSLDYKNGATDTLKDILDRSCRQTVLGLEVPSLSTEDFFIHLCAHLYKEATTLPWVEMKRDMTLYKYCDIYLLLSEMVKDEVTALFTRARALGLEKICSFAVVQTAQLFDVDNTAAVDTASAILEDDPEFIHTVVSPRDNRILCYEEKDIFERFFVEDRSILLKEVTP